MDMILRNIYQVLVDICKQLENMNELKREEILRHDEMVEHE